MRSAVYVFALALSLMASAAPLFDAQHTTGPALFSHDPYSIHRRSVGLIKRNADLEDESMLADLDAEAEDALAGAVSLEACSTECGIIKIEGVKSEKEALCSETGLEATKTCAQCIDSTWPNTRFQETAMSEYENLVSLCEAGKV